MWGAAASIPRVGERVRPATRYKAGQAGEVSASPLGQLNTCSTDLPCDSLLSLLLSPHLPLVGKLDKTAILENFRPKNSRRKERERGREEEGGREAGRGRGRERENKGKKRKDNPTKIKMSKPKANILHFILSELNIGHFRLR